MLPADDATGAAGESPPATVAQVRRSSLPSTRSRTREGPGPGFGVYFYRMGMCEIVQTTNVHRRGRALRTCMHRQATRRVFDAKHAPSVALRPPARARRTFTCSREVTNSECLRRRLCFRAARAASWSKQDANDCKAGATGHLTNEVSEPSRWPVGEKTRRQSVHTEKFGEYALPDLHSSCDQKSIETLLCTLISNRRAAPACIPLAACWWQFALFAASKSGIWVRRAPRRVSRRDARGAHSFQARDADSSPIHGSLKWQS